MLKNIRRSFLWDKVLSLENKEDFLSALKKLEEMEKISPLRFYERAMRATLLLRSDHHEAARQELRKVILDLVGHQEYDVSYVRIYCEHILASLDGNLDEKRAKKIEATKLNCSAYIKKWLPL